MHEDYDGKNHETFPHIPDKPSKPWNFPFSKLSWFTVLKIINIKGSGDLSDKELWNKFLLARANGITT